MFMGANSLFTILTWALWCLKTRAVKNSHLYSICFFTIILYLAEQDDNVKEAEMEIKSVEVKQKQEKI